MIFTESILSGAWVIDIDPIYDKRGFFSRCFCCKEFVQHGLKSQPVQSNISFNINAGTLRGMHYQLAPMSEAKLVRCTAGAIYDVIIDLRRDSPTYKKWYASELTAENRRALYVPEGFAHGFQTLLSNTEVIYEMFEYYSPGHSRGIRWNDPTFSIDWPMPNPLISGRDSRLPLFDGSSL